MGMSRVILFNKPYGVLPQFTDTGTTGSPRPTLSNFIDVPGVYPAGRLDMDSEGLMILTDDGRLQARISDPRYKLPKIYRVQVEGDVSDDALVWPRDPPIRVRQTVPDSWIVLVIREGRNRQVRRMTAAVGHPTLRLVRHGIGDWTLEDLAPGSWREV